MNQQRTMIGLRHFGEEAKNVTTSSHPARFTAQQAGISYCTNVGGFLVTQEGA